MEESILSVKTLHCSYDVLSIIEKVPKLCILCLSRVICFTFLHHVQI